MCQMVAYMRFLGSVEPKSDRGCLTRSGRQRELQSYFRTLTGTILMFCRIGSSGGSGGGTRGGLADPSF